LNRAGSKQAQTQAKTARLVMDKKNNELKVKVKQLQQELDMANRAIQVVKENRQRLQVKAFC
jgi:hypothetical protein